MCPDGNPTFIDKSAGGWTNILSHAHTKRGHSRSWTEFALDELKIKLAQQGGEMGHSTSSSFCHLLRRRSYSVGWNKLSWRTCHSLGFRTSTLASIPTSMSLIVKHSPNIWIFSKTKFKRRLPRSSLRLLGLFSMDGALMVITLYASLLYVSNRLLACGVQDLPDEANGETANEFGFTADDIGDYLYDVQASN